MALYALRLRRAIYLSSSLLNHHPYRPIPFIPSPPSSSISSTESRIPSALDFCSQTLLNQSRAFRSSPVCLARVRSFDRDNTESEIGPDTILFEGCDYNHWLITMDFPKDPKPTSEEMVETYVQTAAKIFGSVEEAKKKIYACSCTTYNGFQVLCDEATSEKFKELPGVVFVLPDSYIDPVNKEYGGDKYENGVITHRPPPVQYGRVRPRYNDRNRDFNQSNRARRPYQQDYAARDNQGPMQADARNFGQQQYPSPQQNYGPQGAGQRRDSMPMNSASGGGDTYQGYRRDPMPSNQSGFNQGQRANYPQSGYNQGQQGNYYPQAGFNHGQQGNYHPPSGYNQGPQGNYYPQANYNQGQQGTYPPQANYYPGQQGNYHPQDQRAFVPGNAPAGADNWNFTSPQEGRNGQALGGGYEQGTGSVPSSNVENYPEQGEQRYSPVDHRNSMQGEQRNYQNRD